MEKFYSSVERLARRHIERKRAKREKEREKTSTIKGEVLSWVDAFVFAIFAVLLINQFLIQLFVIPSPSMVDTLLVGDRVVVSKVAYGTEVYPSGPKVLDSTRRVQRDDIITFYNPNYESKGPFFDILSQIVYMGTLSLVNIDRNDDGTVAERLYVKRAAGLAGDQVKFVDGNVMIRPEGEGAYVPEAEFRADNGLKAIPGRSVTEDYYPGLHAMGRLQAYSDYGLTSAQNHLLADYAAVSSDSYIRDGYAFLEERAKTTTLLDPTDAASRSELARYRAGIYVPEGHVLPLGDNRDNSTDGRYFGPVSEADVNGKVVGRFWPLNRIGGVD